MKVISHYLQIRVWLQWPQIPPGIWTGDTNCSPNTSSLLFVLASLLFGRLLSTAEFCRDPDDMFSARPGRGSWTIAAPGAGTPCDDGDWLVSRKLGAGFTQHSDPSYRAYSSALAAYTTHKMCLVQTEGGDTFLRAEADWAVMKLLKSASTFTQVPRLAWCGFKGVKVGKRVLDNTEKTNDPCGRKWSLFICLFFLFTFIHFSSYVVPNSVTVN